MKANYICNCVKYQEIFNDATEMAQAVEQSRLISRRKFYKLVYIEPKHTKIKVLEYRQHKNLFILYDINEDIHYFYL
jgi:hypothetical protein